MQTYLDIINMPTMKLTNWLTKEFDFALPDEIDTLADLTLAGRLLSKILNGYTFVSTLLIYAKSLSRQIKRSGDKQACEDMTDKMFVLQVVNDRLKLQYQGLSRRITIKQEINTELHMSERRAG